MSCAFCPQVVTPVVWNKPDIENSVPLWIIILAILAGLLLLALLIYVLYKVRIHMFCFTEVKHCTCFHFTSTLQRVQGEIFDF